MNSLFLRIKKISPWLFGAALSLTTLLMLWPFTPNNDGWIYRDKLEHIFVFILLSCIGLLGYPRQVMRILLGLLIYGAAIELLQQALTSTRQASLGDWLADALGIAIGFAIYRYMIKQYVL